MTNREQRNGESAPLHLPPKERSIRGGLSIKELANGVTVWGTREAVLIRALEAEHPTWVYVTKTIEELEGILGHTFDGAAQVPYFGARLTAEGKENLLGEEDE